MNDRDHNQPAWIIQPLSPYDVAAILQGGCQSGAYMPAVTYYQARQTMNEHGDEVMQYLEDSLGEIPQPPANTSWDGLACFYLSYAVELFAMEHEHLQDWDDDETIILEG